MTVLQARLLVAASAVLHAGWNAMLSRQARRVSSRASAPAVLVLALVGSLLACLASSAKAHLSPVALFWAAVAGAGEAAYFCTLGPALASLPLGAAYGYVRGGGMLLVWAMATVVLGEPLRLLGACGGVLLLAGLMLPSAPGPVAWRVPPPVVLACAAATASYHLAYGRALAAGAEPLVLFTASLAFAVPPLATVLGRAGARELAAALRQAPFALGAAGLLTAAAFVLFLAGLRGLDAGTAFALRNTSVLVAQAISWATGEPVRARGALRCGLIFAGACCAGAS